MRCSEFETELNHLLDERLPMQLSSDAVIHSSQCDACLELLNGYQALFAVSPTRNNPSVNATSVVLPPKKHHERGCRDGIRLFDRSSSRRSAAQRTDRHSNASLGSISSRIPVAFPEGQTAPAGQSANGDLTNQTPTKQRQSVAHSSSQRQWGLGSILVALVPSAAAVYLLGVGLLSQFPATPSANSPGPNQLGIAAVQPQAEPDQAQLATADFSNIDWQETAREWDQQWQKLAIHRASACQMPGVQPYFYSVNGAVEALRNNVIRRDKSKPSK